MYHVEYNHFSKWSHTSLILTGCRMLEQQGLIKLTVHDRSGDSSYPAPEVCGCELIVDGIPAYFDCSDGYNDCELIRRQLEKYPFYFKRSFSSIRNQRFGAYSARMYPLGLNYQVYMRSADRDLFFGVAPNNAVALLKRIVNRFLSHWQRPSSFSRTPRQISRKPRICFMARLWDTAETPEELRHINSTRIAIIRQIKEKYPDNSIGGVFDNAVARELCPDLILNRIVSLQPIYLATMHRSDICIGTMGLFQSIGWKTAEYVAASKAIIHEEIRYELPGDFSAGVNYLTFSSVEECMAQIDFLMQNPEVMHAMCSANREYYQNYAAPDRQVLNAIQIITANKK